MVNLFLKFMGSIKSNFINLSANPSIKIYHFLLWDACDFFLHGWQLFFILATIRNCYGL